MTDRGAAAVAAAESLSKSGACARGLEDRCDCANLGVLGLALESGADYGVDTRGNDGDNSCPRTRAIPVKYGGPVEAMQHFDRAAMLDIALVSSIQSR